MHIKGERENIQEICIKWISGGIKNSNKKGQINPITGDCWKFCGHVFSILSFMKDLNVYKIYNSIRNRYAVSIWEDFPGAEKLLGWGWNKYNDHACWSLCIRRFLFVFCLPIPQEQKQPPPYWQRAAFWNSKGLTLWCQYSVSGTNASNYIISSSLPTSISYCSFIYNNRGEEDVN